MTMLGKHHSAKTRAAQSAAALAQWANPQTRQRTMAAMAEAPMALPSMTAEQRTIYEKLRRIVGRDEALRTAIPGVTG